MVKLHGDYLDLFFIVEADNLTSIPRWHRGSEVMALAHFVGSSRRGYPLADPGFPSGGLSLLKIPHRDISSTMIRQHVAQGRPITRLTPRAVARYVSRHALYRGPSPEHADRSSAPADASADRPGHLANRGRMAR